MNERNASIAATRQLTWPLHAARVAIAITACYALAAPAVYWFGGWTGLTAAAIAALVCLIASAIGAAAGDVLAGRGHALAAMLLAMLVRMALPLVFCIVLEVRPHGPLVQAGLPFYLIGFYLLTLAADTWLSLGRISTGPAPSREL